MSAKHLYTLSLLLLFWKKPTFLTKVFPVENDSFWAFLPVGFFPLPALESSFFTDSSRAGSFLTDLGEGPSFFTDLKNDVIITKALCWLRLRMWNVDVDEELGWRIWVRWCFLSNFWVVAPTTSRCFDGKQIQVGAVDLCHKDVIATQVKLWSLEWRGVRNQSVRFSNCQTTGSPHHTDYSAYYRYEVPARQHWSCCCDRPAL